MAATVSLVAAPVSSQKQRKAAQRKERRKRKRQALAQARECDLKNEEEEEGNDGNCNDDAAETERLQQHEEWLERERLAQDEFRLRTEREEAAKKKKEEEERMIKEEWESQQKREQEEREHRLQEKRNREEAAKKMWDEVENQVENKGPYMNPEAQAAVSSENFGTERDVANCPFFLKTGTCRFGVRCSRKHTYPTDSPTLLIRGMFTTFGMEESQRDDYDIDACLEHGEEELRESFLEFYHDVLPEFKSVGSVVQFKVCCNHEPHLRGNVYVQFATEEQSKEAFIKFNGRWYAGRQLQCEVCPVTRWNSAICGLFDRNKCPKGKHCNFLHVFRNPGNEFWEADRDLQMSPDRSIRGIRRSERHSEQYSERSWRQRRYSRSPVRSERSHSRREDDRQRSRSRDRRSSHQHREDMWASGPRHRDRRTSRHRSRSRSRSRSRGEKNRLRNKSRGKDREQKQGNRSEEISEDEDSERELRSVSREKRKKRSQEKSPKKPDKRKKTNGTNSHHRHKHSKKSKKSKKKHKKKKQMSDVTTSSEDLEGDSPSTQSPSGDGKTEKRVEGSS